MTVLYMVIWSILMVLALTALRLRRLGEGLVIALVTAIVLLLSQTLFFELAQAAGLHPSPVTPIQPAEYLTGGPLAWMALLVMPCGWLGPFLGLHLVEKFQRRYQYDVAA